MAGSELSPFKLPDADLGWEMSTWQFRAALDAIPDNVICQGCDHTVHWVNLAAAGPSSRPEELVGRKCHEIWHQRATPCPSCPTEEALATGVPATRLSQTPDGRTWEVRALPLPDTQGELANALKVARDVTHRLAQEREREDLVRQLGVKNQELEDFAHTVAHDLKGPLVSLKGFVGLMQRSLSLGRSADLVDHLDRVDAAVDQLAEFIDALLGLSSAGATVGSLAAVSLVEVCGEAAALLHGTLDPTTFTCAVPRDFPPVLGDRTRLLQLFLNLLANAAKFTSHHRDPQITVEAVPEAGRVLCAVTDNGIGVSPDQLEWIFGTFHKGDPRGNGLGLAIARRIVTAHGGQVWAESGGMGKGFCVKFTLPLA